MANVSGPTIVRRSPPVYHLKPGLHSHNVRRRPQPTPPQHSFLAPLRTLLLIVGVIGVGYYCYSLADQYVYQAYQNWAFDQQIAGRREVTFADYVRERTPFGFVLGAEPTRSVGPRAQQDADMPRPALGSVIGRVEVPRLGIAAMVREGVDAKTLSIAVGHVPSTALPGRAGNFAIAAHRDTLFRALKNIRRDDLVTFRSAAGTYTYQVVAMKIVLPSDVSVLRPDGGGLIPVSEVSAGRRPEKLLTMITCYPFYYVGSAPKRFIVEAKLVSNDPEIKLSNTVAQSRVLLAAHAKHRRFRAS